MHLVKLINFFQYIKSLNISAFQIFHVMIRASLPGIERFFGTKSLGEFLEDFLGRKYKEIL